MKGKILMTKGFFAGNEMAEPGAMPGLYHNPLLKWH
jgi:hypothetical protein